jgi:diguanylate cyclase (GGDEF)-like protein
LPYKGRIIAFIIMIINGFVDIFYSISSKGFVEIKTLIILFLIEIPMGWFIGKQFDKVKYLNNKLQHMAYHDSLTGLPNRYKLANDFQKALTNSKLNNRRFAVLFIDLDRFKFINDTMGHDTGDKLLIQVSNRLKGNVRSGDVVARQGGDEFIILLENIAPTEVTSIAERIVNSFNIPFILEGEEYFSSPSIGISLFPKDGKDFNTLIKNADNAMYVSKSRGKNTFYFYNQENNENLDRRFKLERGLKTALENNEFTLHYQPKVELKTGNIYGAEALIRWNHPEFGLVSPTEFIPITEETGMILPIGNWILREACKQNKRWHEAGIEILVSVNVSSLQFEDRSFIEKVKKAIAESQLAPEYLRLEITESVMQNIKHSAAIIHELKNIGVKISVDDFGTGYSSLSILNNLPIDIIKIDKSFVNEMIANTNTASLVKTMIEI